MSPLLRATAPYVIATASMVVAILGVRWYGTSQYQAGVDKANADYMLADLTEFKNQSARLGGISSTLEDALVALRNTAPKTIERYTRVEVQSPLPAGCRIDSERLRHINDAARLANAASQSGAAVSVRARGDQR